MSDIGRVSLGVEFTGTEQAARKFAKDTQDKLKRALTEGFDVPELPTPLSQQALKDIQARKDAVKQETEAAQQARERELAGISKAEATKRKQINDTFAEAEKLRVKSRESASKNAQAETAAYLRARDAQEKADIRAANNKINQAKRASAAVIKEQEKQIAFQQRLGVLQSQAIKDNEAFDRENKQLGGIGGVFQKATRAIDGADSRLKKFGITTRDISVILGAGLAGGIAFVARELLQFGIACITVAGQVESLRNVTELTFGEFANVVDNFAKTSAESLGLSERAAREAANRFGLFFKNIGLASQDAAQFSTKLTTLAVALSRVTGGAKTVDEAITAITAVLRGEFDTIEQFGIKISQAAIENEALNSGLSKSGKNLTEQQKALAAINLIMEKSGIAMENLTDSEKSLMAQQAAMTAQIEDIKTALGELLLPLVKDFLTGLNDLLAPILATARALSALATGINNLIDILPGLSHEVQVATGEFDEMGNAITRTEKTSNRFGDGLKALLGFLNPFKPTGDKFRDVFDAINGAMEDTNDTIDAQIDKADTLAAFYRAEQENIQLTKEELDQLTDARERYLRAILDAERQEDDAERSLQRTREDSRRRMVEAQDDIADAVRDKQRAMDDAERKITETQVKTARQVRDAQERLADARREDKRAREKEVKELKKIEQDHANDITEALISIEEAQRKGDLEAENKARRDLTRLQQDKSVEDKRKEIAQNRADREREIDRLERDLHEEKLDRLKEIQDAKREAEEALIDSNERIADSEQALADLEIDINRDLFDAQKRLNDARREGAEQVSDAAKDIERLGVKASEAKAKIDAFLDSVERLINIINAPLLSPDADITGNTGESTPESLADILLGNERARGGGVKAGQPYIVGEEGPEVVIPGRSGQVISNEQLMRVLQEMLGQGSGTNVNQNIAVYEAVNPAVTASAIASRLTRGL